MNSITFTGRLGKDPEIKKNSNGTEYVALNIAVDRIANKQRVTDWIPTVFLGSSASTVNKYVGKGGRVSVTGTLTTNTYEKDGKKNTSFSVIVDKFDIIDFKETAEKKSETPEQVEMPFEF